MSLSFVLLSLAWTGCLALGAELLTRTHTSPHFAQKVWRICAGLMALPWAGLLVPFLIPQADLILPDLPDINMISSVETSLLATVSSLPLKTSSSIDLETFILAVLITGWTVRLISALLAEARLNILRRLAEPYNAPAAKTAVANWSDMLSLGRPPALAIMPGKRSPFVTGLFDRTLYLPAHLKDTAYIDLIIAHECTHIARGDMFTRPIERLIADLLWFSPFAWLARYRLDYWREAVCDAETVALTQAPVAYARALTHVARTAQISPSLPVAAFILTQKRKTLPMRVSAILTPCPQTSRLRTVAGVAALLIAAPLALAQGLGETGSSKSQNFSSPIFKAPLPQKLKITSTYGVRKDPFSKASAFHSGTDISAPLGTPLAAPADGQIIFTGYKDGYGNMIDLRLAQSGDVLRYAQLSEIMVAEGDRVTAGKTVGLVGSSGRSTGPHLHLEYIKPKRDAAETGDTTSKGAPHDPQEIEGLVLFER